MSRDQPNIARDARWAYCSRPLRNQNMVITNKVVKLESGPSLFIVVQMSRESCYQSSSSTEAPRSASRSRQDSKIATDWQHCSLFLQYGHQCAKPSWSHQERRRTKLSFFLDRNQKLGTRDEQYKKGSNAETEFVLQKWIGKFMNGWHGWQGLTANRGSSLGERYLQGTGGGRQDGS